MNIHNIKDSFWRIGSRVMVEPRRGPLGLELEPRFLIGRDGQGEHFRLVFHPLQVRSIEVADVKPGQRSLLAVIHQRPRQETQRRRANPHRRFLCGRDDKGLYAFALPEGSEAHNVTTAIDALEFQAIDAASRMVRRENDRLALTASPNRN